MTDLMLYRVWHDPELGERFTATPEEWTPALAQALERLGVSVCPVQARSRPQALLRAFPDIQWTLR